MKLGRTNLADMVKPTDTEVRQLLNTMADLQMDLSGYLRLSADSAADVIEAYQKAALAAEEAAKSLMKFKEQLNAIERLEDFD